METLRLINAALRGLLGVYLRDPNFYLQLGLFALLVVLVWLMARQLRRAQWTLPGWRWQTKLDPFYFPLLALVGGRLIAGAFALGGRELPIFARLYALAWVLFFYRLAVALVQKITPKRAEMIQKRILLPLALLVVTLRLVGQLGLFFRVLNQPLFYINRGTPEQIAISLPLIVLGPLSVFAIFAIAQGLRSVLIEDILPNVGLSTSRAYAVGTLLSYAMVIIGSLVALAALGVSPGSLAVFGSALAVGIGFGLQNTVNNFVSGFLIMFDPLINVGDTIEINNERGVIRYIGIRNSMIEALDGTQVVIPNGTLASSAVLNLNQSRRLVKVTLLLPLALTAEPHRVLAAIRELLAAHDGVENTPEPLVALQRFEAATMIVEVTFWVGSLAVKGSVTSEVNLAIWDELGRLGVSLAPPTVPPTPTG